MREQETCIYNKNLLGSATWGSLTPLTFVE